MAKLSTAARKRIPTRKFAGPGRSFPVHDRAHAVAALRLVGRSVKAGNISGQQASRIRGKARRVLQKLRANSKRG